MVASVKSRIDFCDPQSGYYTLCAKNGNELN
jgi:hypothetical protein